MEARGDFSKNIISYYFSTILTMIHDLLECNIPV